MGDDDPDDEGCMGYNMQVSCAMLQSNDCNLNGRLKFCK